MTAAAIPESRLAEILAALNGYEHSHPHAMTSDTWQDVILDLDEYDEHKTHADAEAFVLTDGTEIYWDRPTRQWAVGGKVPR